MSIPKQSKSFKWRTDFIQFCINYEVKCNYINTFINLIRKIVNYWNVKYFSRDRRILLLGLTLKLSRQFKMMSRTSSRLSQNLCFCPKYRIPPRYTPQLPMFPLRAHGIRRIHFLPVSESSPLLRRDRMLSLVTQSNFSRRHERKKGLMN